MNDFISNCKEGRKLIRYYQKYKGVYTTALIFIFLGLINIGIFNMHLEPDEGRIICSCIYASVGITVPCVLIYFAEMDYIKSSPRYEHILTEVFIDVFRLCSIAIYLIMSIVIFLKSERPVYNFMMLILPAAMMISCMVTSDILKSGRKRKGYFLLTGFYAGAILLGDILKIPTVGNKIIYFIIGLCLIEVSARVLRAFMRRQMRVETDMSSAMQTMIKQAQPSKKNKR